MTQEKPKDSTALVTVPGQPVASFLEGSQIIRDFICGTCMGMLSLPWGGAFGQNNYLVMCVKDKTHRGFALQETAGQYIERRGDPGTLAAAVENKEVMRQLIRQVTNQILANFSEAPQGEVPQAEVAAFVMDCVALELDPRFGFIFPIPYWSKTLARYYVVPRIAWTGWLALAERNCREKWGGVPTVLPVVDPAIKKAVAGNDTAEVWVATGKVRLNGEMVEAFTAYGWVQSGAFVKGVNNTPGNQAAVRAVRRFLSLNYPDAVNAVNGFAARLKERAAGLAEAQRIIEAEFTVVDDPTPAPGAPPAGLAGAPGASPAPAPRQATATPAQRPASSERMASENQTKALYAISRSLGWDRDRLVRELGGKTPDELTFADASLGIDRLKKLEEAAKPKLTP